MNGTSSVIGLQTLDEWADLACQLAGTKVPPVGPRFLAYLSAVFGEAISSFTKRPPLLSLETYRIVTHGFQVDGTKAAKELGVEYTPFEEGSRKTIVWYWEQGLLKQEPACAIQD